MNTSREVAKWISGGLVSWVLGLCVLCAVALWRRWWWVFWVRLQSRHRGTVVAETCTVGISDGSNGRGSCRIGLKRRAIGGGSKNDGGIGVGGEEGRRIPRGSTGWPLIGETLDFIACGYTSRPVSFMEKRRELYGRVFKSHILGTRIVVSTDAEVNRAVLQNHGAGFVPCYPRSVAELLGDSSILQKEGSLHRRVHGLIGGFLKSPAAKAQVADGIRRCVEQSLRRWHTGQLVYIQDEAKEIAFQVLVKVLMGIDPGEELNFLKKEFTEFIQGIICVPVKLPGTRLSKSLKAKEKILKIIKKTIEDRMSNCERSSVHDVIDVLLNDNDNDTNEKQQISIDSICGSITEMMIPGDHSVPMLMTLAVKYLTDSPLVLKQLTTENLNLKRNKNNCGEPYAWTDYMSLTFTQYVINETLRMGNIINGVWRKAVKDVEIKGYLIPKDWCVLASFSSIHLDEENYVNPYEFNPWRWQMKGNSQSNFTPFGGGQRLCPGLDLSRLEVSIFLHHLVTTYSWVAEEDGIINFPTVNLKKKMPIRVSEISI